MYQLFVAEKCTECQEVLDFVQSSNVECAIHNVDTGSPSPPLNVFAFPALFSDKILLAYGSDIIEYLKKKA